MRAAPCGSDSEDRRVHFDPVVRNNPCRFSDQAILMVQSDQKLVRDNRKVSRYAMRMIV